MQAIFRMAKKEKPQAIFRIAKKERPFDATEKCDQCFVSYLDPQSQHSDS
jgi:hypothetical protein